MADTEEIKRLLSLCSSAQRQEIFQYLREEFPIHPLEVELNTEAEIILEAIQRSGGLTLRMIRGVIAEAAFEIEVVEHLEGWHNITPQGDLPYDFLLDDGQGAVRVQVKLQRSLAHRPMWAVRRTVSCQEICTSLKPSEHAGGAIKGREGQHVPIASGNLTCSLLRCIHPRTSGIRSCTLLPTGCFLGERIRPRC